MPNKTPKYVAVERHGMRFILHRDNNIVLRADHLSMEQLKAMADGLSQPEEPVTVSKQETPKSKCCNASPVFAGLTHICSVCGQMFVYCEPENLQMNSSSIDKTDKTIYPPTKEQIARQCTCGLQAHPQPNCPAAKKPNDIPDAPHIIFNRKIIELVDKLQECEIKLKSNAQLIEFKDNEITKLKSKLKECVEVIMEMIDESGGEYHTDHNCPEDDTCECPLANQINNVIISSKGLYE